MGSYIIAEAGVNHDGDLNKAMALIDAAKFANADAVKFQTFQAKKLVTFSANMASYQKKNTRKDQSQYEMLSRLELSKDDYLKLLNYCSKKNIEFLSSPFDIPSIDLLNELNLEKFKIPSGEITNFPYLKHLGKLNKVIILSTGMATIEEIKDALAVLISSGTKKDNISILHANTMYPTPINDVNLLAMLTIKSKFGHNVGYSDHTLGIEVPLAAVVLGAKIIEKHLTLDKLSEGPDHISSLDPNEFKSMVDSIRNIEKCLGNGDKVPSLSEKENIPIVRKSIVAAKKISKGEVFTEENITVKRPGNGISPMNWNDIIGKKATKDYEEDSLI